MIVHPDIAALRSDRAPQRHAQGAMKAAADAWRAEPGADRMLAELDRFGAGAALEACPQLEAMFTQQSEAERLMARMSHHYCSAIAANPIGHPPFRNGYNGQSSSLLLARSGRAQLMLQAREPGEYDNAGHMFSDALRYDAIVGGKASSRLVRMIRRDKDGAEFSHERITLQPGVRLAIDLSSETLEIDRVDQRLVVLRLLRNAENPQPNLEFDAGSGAMLQQSAGSLATSRQEATIALLGRMGRTDAAPQMAFTALGEGDASLRWQALRECIALDTERGFIALCQLARRAGDPLASSAGALRAQLLETYPQLGQLESARCPA